MDAILQLQDPNPLEQYEVFGAEESGGDLLGEIIFLWSHSNPRGLGYTVLLGELDLCILEQGGRKGRGRAALGAMLTNS
jgi:hypothetical protein